MDFCLFFFLFSFILSLILPQKCDLCWCCRDTREVNTSVYAAFQSHSCSFYLSSLYGQVHFLCVTVANLSPSKICPSSLTLNFMYGSKKFWSLPLQTWNCIRFIYAISVFFGTLQLGIYQGKKIIYWDLLIVNWNLNRKRCSSDILDLKWSIGRQYWKSFYIFLCQLA